MGQIELMCLPIGSFYFCFLYKKQGYIFLHLGSARNKRTNIRNHGGKKTRGKHWRNQRSPLSKFTFRHPVIHLYPTLQRASCARWLKTSAGPELNGKERPRSLQGEKAEFGERELPSHGGLNRNAEQAKDCPNSRPPLQGQSKCARMGHSPPRSHLTDWLTPWARQTISGWLLYMY